MTNSSTLRKYRDYGALTIDKQKGVHGCQYTSYAFGKCCGDMKVMSSMGSAGGACDNVMTESFFATLERELLNLRRFHTQAQGADGGVQVA